MRNYNHQVEAAYLMSRRQGDAMRDRERERGTHDNRQNRYIDSEQQYGSAVTRESYDTRDSYRTPDSGYHQQLPQHQGKGPRNYKPSDTRLKEKICDLFCDDPYLDATNIEVAVNQREVVLTGSVDDRYAKRLAEDLAESVSGVEHIENRIRVNQDKKQSYQREQINQDIS